LTEADNIIKDATQMILNGEVEPSKITKSVLVLDEAQDMDESNYNP
jgi:ATP-dependent DNA helicase RecQ